LRALDVTWQEEEEEEVDGGYDVEPDELDGAVWRRGWAFLGMPVG